MLRLIVALMFAATISFVATLVPGNPIWPVNLVAGIFCTALAFYFAEE